MLPHILHDVPKLLGDQRQVSVLHDELLTLRPANQLLVFVREGRGPQSHRVSMSSLALGYNEVQIQRGMISSSTGSGKSFAAKRELTWMLSLNGSVGVMWIMTDSDIPGRRLDINLHFSK